MKRLLILLAVLAATAFFSAPAVAGGCYGYGGYRSYYRPSYSYRSYYRPYHSHYHYGSYYRPYGGFHHHHHFHR